MFNNNKILVIIPAKGSSKDIPRKNARLLGEKPIISYMIEACKNSQYVDDVVVSSDDNKVSRITERIGGTVVRPSEELNYDENLEEIIHSTMLKKESLAFDEYDIVITILPDSPLLKTSTLDKMIERFENQNIDTVIAVKGDRQLYWIFDDESKAYRALYPQRQNLNFLPKTFKETGNFVASRRQFITPESMIGQNVDLFEVSDEESVSIKTYADWGIASNYLKKKKIVFVVSVDEFGSDNIFRCLSISSRIFFHEVLFLLEEGKDLLINNLDKYGYPYDVFRGTNDLVDKINEFKPDVVFNDMGDTSEEYMFKLKEAGHFVVNFRDYGEGYPLADLVFDDLYEHNLGESKIKVGKDYFILKDSFFLQNLKIVNTDVNQVLLFFEGADLNNLSERVLNILIRGGFSKYIHVVLGASYENKQDFIDKYQIYSNVIIYKNSRNLYDLLFKSDIAILSAGRAMYEACAMNVPSIILCQNERETSRIFANYHNGFINLGLVDSLSDEDILNQFNLLKDDFDKRREMSNKMRKIDLKYGFDNVWYEIKKAYRKFIFEN